MVSAVYAPEVYRRHPPYYPRGAFQPPPPMRSPRVAHSYPRYYYTPTSGAFVRYSTHASPTSSAKEVEAATALISLPSSVNHARYYSSITGFRRPAPSSSRTTSILISPLTSKRKSVLRIPLGHPTSASGPTTPSRYSGNKVVFERIPLCQPTSPSGPVTPSPHHAKNNIVSPPRSHGCITDASSVSSNDTGRSPGMETESEEQWYAGSVSLALPQDDDVLSPLHCFLRRHCVEAFSATTDDVDKPRYGKSHGGRIVIGQVGIRCLHCKHLPPHRRPERAVCYPSSLRNIYHSIETWQRRHSIICTGIPTWIKMDLTRLLKDSRSNAGGRRQHWEDAAKRVGLIDTPYGVRFAQRPGVATDHEICDAVEEESSPLVHQEDKPIVTDFLFLLMSQMERCRFTEEDRIGGRSKVKDYPVGFPGMQCKHCRGKAGFGRYFPSSANALALANSDRNIYNHIRKCRRCPESTKHELRRLQRQHAEKGSKNMRGSRKKFFTNVWERMNGEK